jgi:hypothetical protein
MTLFTQAVHAWESPQFNATFKAGMEALPPDSLPLQQGLCHSSYVGTTPHKAIVLSSIEEADQLKIKCGIFYGGIIAGCQCADDPSPAEECQEYCEVMVLIDKASCRAKITLLETEA